MDELFSNLKDSHEPLAARMRPRTLDEYIGQEHIVGKGRLLRRAIAADQLTSVIFYGPPGTGKTYYAHIYGSTSKNGAKDFSGIIPSCFSQPIRKGHGHASGSFQNSEIRMLVVV